MKKLISLLIILTLVASLFVACKDETPAEKDYSLAIGVATTENLGSAKITHTVATVVTDAEGKIVLCQLDCVDYSAKAKDGTINTTAPTSKVALGDNYSMPAGSWAAQAGALAAHVKGMTRTEVAAIALNGGVLSDADLKASCSINVVDLLKAIDNAFASEHKMTFKTASSALTLGLSAVATAKDTSTDDAKAAKLSVDFAAAALADGAVVASILDSADAELKNITDDGAEFSFKGTKRAQGDAYGSMPAGTWYVQADAYAAAAVGKTADDIATLASEGVAGCSIYAGGYKQAIEAAVKAAK